MNTFEQIADVGKNNTHLLLEWLIEKRWRQLYFRENKEILEDEIVAQFLQDFFGAGIWTWSLTVAR
jgi:hypothetical protein